MRFLFLLALISSTAFAQAGICATGRPCNVRSVVATDRTSPTFCARNPNGIPWSINTSTNNTWRLQYDGAAAAACPRPGFEGSALTYSIAGSGSLTVNGETVSSLGYSASLALGNFPTCNSTINGRQLYDTNARLWRVCDGSTTGSGWVPVHATMSEDRRSYVLDPQNTPAWLTSTPRSGGTAVTVAVVDAAAAASSSIAHSNGSLVPARQMNTGAVIGSTSSLFIPTWANHVVGRGRACWRMQLGSTTSSRYWSGFMSALPGASDSPAIHHVSFRYSTNAADTAFQACYGTAGTTCTTTGVAADTSSHLMCIDCGESNNSAATFACTWSIDGVSRARVTSGIPSGSVLGWGASVEARAASARSLELGTVSVVSNF